MHSFPGGNLPFLANAMLFNKFPYDSHIAIRERYENDMGCISEAVKNKKNI